MSKAKRRALTPMQRYDRAVAEGRLDEARRLAELMEQRAADGEDRAWAAAHPPERRDGLLWLARGGRMPKARFEAALSYRDAFREAAPAIAGVDWSREVRTGHRQRLPDRQAGMVDARRRLVAYRDAALAGDTETARQMRLLMDRVVGEGRTLTALAEGDSRAVLRMETLLNAALDRIVDFEDTGAPATAKHVS